MLEENPFHAALLEQEGDTWRDCAGRLLSFWGPTFEPLAPKIEGFRVARKRILQWITQQLRPGAPIGLYTLNQGERLRDSVVFYERRLREEIAQWILVHPRADRAAETWLQSLEKLMDQITQQYEEAVAYIRAALPVSASPPASAVCTANDLSASVSPGAVAQTVINANVSPQPLRNASPTPINTLIPAPASDSRPAFGIQGRSDPMIGERAGNYILCELLGEGGMGSVYLANHAQIGRRAAVKVLAPHLSGHADLADRFLSEAKAIARIEHPNVIQVFDFGWTAGGQLFYVMEYLPGEELAQIINARTPLDAAEVEPYVEQICSGLHAAHERSIIHRDLKPENIFVTSLEPLTVKLLDFGLAKLLNNSPGSCARTANGMIMGTPLTIAPEQALGLQDEIGPATDIYSLGVILFWMLTGRPPFDAEQPSLLLVKHIHDPPPLISTQCSGLPAEIEQLVDQCLQKKPHQRPASALEVAERFAAALGVKAHLSLAPSDIRRIHLPAAGGSASSPFNPSISTLRQAEGELAPRTSREHHVRWRSWLWVWSIVAITLVAGLASAVFILAREEGGPQAVVTASASPPELVEPLPLPAPPQPASHTVRVETSTGRIPFRYRIDDQPFRRAVAPCPLVIPHQRRLTLQLRRKGFKPLHASWRITAPKELRLTINKRLRQWRLLVKETRDSPSRLPR